MTAAWPTPNAPWRCNAPPDIAWRRRAHCARSRRRSAARTSRPRPATNTRRTTSWTSLRRAVRSSTADASARPSPRREPPDSTAADIRCGCPPRLELGSVWYGAAYAPYGLAHQRGADRHGASAAERVEHAGERRIPSDDRRDDADDATGLDDA